MVHHAHLLVDAVTLVITLAVPAIVWLLLLAGLFELVRDGLRRIHILPIGIRRTTHEGVS
jgi:hypothetical protein